MRNIATLMVVASLATLGSVTRFRVGCEGSNFVPGADRV
jgi:hypothetical protein